MPRTPGRKESGRASSSTASSLRRICSTDRSGACSQRFSIRLPIGVSVWSRTPMSVPSGDPASDELISRLRFVDGSSTIVSPVSNGTRRRM